MTSLYTPPRWLPSGRVSGSRLLQYALRAPGDTRFWPWTLTAGAVAPFDPAQPVSAGPAAPEPPPQAKPILLRRVDVVVRNADGQLVPYRDEDWR